MAAVIKSDGLFIEPNFLDRHFVARVRREVEQAPQYSTPLQDLEKRIELETPPKSRPKSAFDISKDLQNELEKKISDLKPYIEDFFSLALGNIKIPYYAVYRQGDFLDRHADANRSGILHPSAEWTKVAMVIFLNDNNEAGGSDTYEGGNLTIYGLINNSMFEEFGYPIKGETGKLVAFRSTCIHEVTPITRGIRYVVNSGYY